MQTSQLKNKPRCTGTLKNERIGGVIGRPKFFSETNLSARNHAGLTLTRAESKLDKSNPEQGRHVMKKSTPQEAGVAWILSMVPKKDRYVSKDPHEVLQRLVEKQQQAFKKEKAEGYGTKYQSDAVSTPEVGSPS